MTRDELVDVLVDATSTGQIERALIYNGFALVPIEPTEAMVEAGVSAEWGGTLGSRVTNSFQAMIKAAEEG